MAAGNFDISVLIPKSGKESIMSNMFRNKEKKGEKGKKNSHIDRP